MIETDGLGKSFQGRPAVQDLTFSVRQGEIFGFLGPNGAGKSTTLRLLLGLLPPDTGRARVAGFDCWRESKRVHQLCGVAFEISNLYERMTARENLTFFARLTGRGRADVDWALEAVGLAERAHENVQSFSRGMRQRLILARAMLHRPRLLFLDEPTAGLDPNSAADIRALIAAFGRQGTTIFLTTHDMVEAETLCHRIGILHQGRLVGLGSVAQLKSRFGEPLVEITLPRASPPVQRIFHRSDPAWLEEIARLQADGVPFWVHTREATLQQVFHRLTRPGRGSGGDDVNL